MSAVTGLTLFHVIVSLIAIVAGIALAHGLLTGKRHDRWTFLFMLTTAVTVLTGFLFPYNGFTPGIGVGILCVLIFVPTALARYRLGMSGVWRPFFIAGALALFYFNCLVFVVQSFQKIPTLNALAPTGGEPIVAVVQSIVLIAFIVIGFFSIRRFRPTALGL
ncbi:hypothetical protein ACC732_21730 [Rhizobium ruizarguesonis]